MKYASSQVADSTLLSISEVGAASGLEASALRYYERVGLISSSARLSGRRHYDPSVLGRLAAIRLFQEVGFTIAEIVQLLAPDATAKRWQAMATEKLAQIDEHLTRVAAARELLVAARDCGCATLDSCGLVAGRRGGHREVVRRVTLPPVT